MINCNRSFLIIMGKFTIFELFKDSLYISCRTVLLLFFKLLWKDILIKAFEIGGLGLKSIILLFLVRKM